MEKVSSAYLSLPLIEGPVDEIAENPSITQRFIGLLPKPMKEVAQCVNEWVLSHRYLMVATAAFLVPSVVIGNPARVLLSCVVGDVCGQGSRPLAIMDVPKLSSRVCSWVRFDDIIWLVTAATVAGLAAGFPVMGALCLGVWLRPVSRGLAQRGVVV